jgi:GTP 3',8-cyclase
MKPFQESAMVKDLLNRPLRDLRISVTDRCNFRCFYCMPFDEYEWLGRQELLTYEEIARLARIFSAVGVDKVRLTGGEPLVRKDLDVLIRALTGIEGLRDVCVTTNGALLADSAESLKTAGLKRINVSLDTLDAARFKQITRRGELSKVLDGLFAARRCGFHPIKINAVIARGVNDDEILPIVEFSRANGFGVRFIEYMDVGNANGWRLDKVVPKAEILRTISGRFPLAVAGRAGGSAPAVDYRFTDGQGEVGVIASVTEPFCGDCNRARLTSDGKLVTCLFSETGHDLKSPLRNGATDEELSKLIADIWNARQDRFSEERFQAISTEGYQPARHRKIEMIVLGG